MDTILAKHKAKPKRVANNACRQYVMDQIHFQGSNLYGMWQNNIYTVYSYGAHFPMYAYDSEADQWCGNKDKFSRSTTRHQFLARPYDVDIQWVDTATLETISWYGVAGAVARRMQAVAA